MRFLEFYDIPGITVNRRFFNIQKLVSFAKKTKTDHLNQSAESSRSGKSKDSIKTFVFISETVIFQLARVKRISFQMEFFRRLRPSSTVAPRHLKMLSPRTMLTFSKKFIIFYSDSVFYIINISLIFLL